jgi:DNA-binding PucR family transcriptional regulator
VQLGELVAAPRLKLRVLHEPRGAMQRQVGRVVTTDLLDSARYLSGGELVTTGLVWRRSPEDSERFVQGLVDAGTIALAAGDAQFGSIPEDLVEACRRHGLPLLEVPVEVAFADVAEYVAAHGVPGSGARLSATVGRQRQLLNAIASGRSLDELVERVSRDAGRTCRIISPTGRHVVPGPSPLEADDLDRVTAAFLEADRLPVAVTAGGAPYSLFTVGSGLGNRIAAWILVADGDWAEWQQEEVEAVNELAAIAALDRSRRQEGLRAVQHIADEALALVAAGGGQHDSGTRLRQAGVEPSGPMVAVVLELADDGSGRTDLLELARAVAYDVALGFGHPVVAADGDRRMVALLPAGADCAALLRRAFERLAPGTARHPLRVGVSSPAAVGALSGALDEARYACRLAQARQAPVSVTTADEMVSHVTLLAALPDEVRRAFATRVLGPVLEYDARNDAGLFDTLRAFMDCSGSWSRTAESLHVHVNTVRYRIARVGQLTGRDLSSLEDRVDVFLALRSM